MPVFDFHAPAGQESRDSSVSNITILYSDLSEADPEHPIVLLDHKQAMWPHHSGGFFTNPEIQASFLFETEKGQVEARILAMDSRFVSLLQWLGRNRIHVRLSGKNTEEGYAVYKIRETME